MVNAITLYDGPRDAWRDHRCPREVAAALLRNAARRAEEKAC